MHSQHAVMDRPSPWVFGEHRQHHQYQHQEYHPALGAAQSAAQVGRLSSSSASLAYLSPELAVRPRRRLPSPRAVYSSSAATMQNIPTEEEYANLQRLSNDYQPQVEGPLVGKRQSSNAIINEYAGADDVFVRKTAALPAKYSHYRTIRGDGNCGWRAIAFSYFEILQRIGDRDRVFQEITRLTSLNNLLNSIGVPEHLWEDFFEETIGLLKSLLDTVAVPFDESSLLEKFNDPSVSSAVIAHFRLLTSAWMKTHPADYEPFLENATTEQYCALAIEPYQIEIENVGITALADVLLKPIGIALEVLYLDRSVGQEVNSHRFESVDMQGNPMNPNAPTMRLLYRPGHYDILYKLEDVDGVLSETQVAMLRYSTTYDMPQQLSMAEADAAALTPYLSNIPGMSFAPMPDHGLTPVGLDSNSLLSNGYANTPISPVSPAFPSPSLSLSPGVADGGSGSGSFRPSKYEYAAEFSTPPPQNLPFQTPTFRNSHFNPAHFRNQDFQPEIWSPESEDANKSPKGEKRRASG